MKYFLIVLALFLAGCATESPEEKAVRAADEERRALCALHGLDFVSEYHERIRWPSRNHRVVWGAVCTDGHGKQVVVKDNGKPDYGS